MKREDAEPEIRRLIVGMLERESADDAAQPVRARAADHRRAQRAVRPRPARGAARAIRSISDILVNRFDQVYIERNGKLEETDIVVQGRSRT